MSNIQNKIRNLTATTDGKGYWNRKKRTVRINEITVESVVDSEGDEIVDGSTKTPDAMVLRVYFPKRDWNTETDGLIYTDKKWIKELRMGLRSIGLESAGIDYTEQGMQGDDFVSVAVYTKKTILSLLKSI